MNKVTLMGRLGQNPEVKEINGSTVANFSLATNEVWKDKDGNKQEETTWHNCAMWGPRAKVIGDWVKKGDGLLVEGRIKVRTYEKDGIKRYATDIVCHNFEFPPTRKESRGGSAGADVGTFTPPAESSDDLPF